MADHGGPADRAANKRDLSVSMARANVVAHLLVLPPMLVLYLAYGALWGFGIRFEIGGLAGPAALYGVGALTFVVGVVAHELLHGFSFVLIGKQPLANVKLLGFQRETLTPYSHCKVPVKAGAYRWAVSMPGLVLGVAPSLFGIATGNGWVILFGLFFLFAAAGDALILWLVRGVGGDELVEDHPRRAGCYVIEG